MRTTSRNTPFNNQRLASVLLDGIGTQVTPKPKAPADVASMALLDELSNAELMKLTGVHITSVRRWRRLGKLPVHIQRLLDFMALRRLEQLG
jgi:hypothetical protein